jgi:hypothetical protein
VVTSGGVGPFAGGTFAGLGAVQADEQRAPLGVADVADEPVAALAGTVGKVVTANCLGVARETVSEVGCFTRHGQATARSAMPDTG